LRKTYQDIYEEWSYLTKHYEYFKKQAPTYYHPSKNYQEVCERMEIIEDEYETLDDIRYSIQKTLMKPIKVLNIIIKKSYFNNLLDNYNNHIKLTKKKKKKKLIIMNFN